MKLYRNIKAWYIKVKRSQRSERYLLHRKKCRATITLSGGAFVHVTRRGKHHGQGYVSLGHENVKYDIEHRRFVEADSGAVINRDIIKSYKIENEIR